MTATDDESDLAYFRTLEEIFASLRATPLLLSPADFAVAARWRREGVPLDLVRAALELAFRRREERRAKGQVNSLRYLAPAVDEAWAEAREMAAPGEPGPAAPIDVPARLAALAAALPAETAGGAELAARVLALRGGSAVVEQALAFLDAELLARAGDSLAPALAAEVDAAVEQTVATLAARLPAAEIERARDRLRQQVLRKRLGLPILSLFSPAADPPGRPEGDEP
jgi:hypothetical protein